MSAAMEDAIWKELGGLDNAIGEHAERIEKAERRLVVQGRRTVAVAVVDGIFNLAFYGILIWFVVQLMWWKTGPSAPAISAYCI